MPEPRPLDDFILKAQTQQGSMINTVIEQRIRILLRPKPRWLPGWFWDQAIKALLLIEQGPRLENHQSGKAGAR